MCGGKTSTVRTPDHLIDWKGNDWTPGVRRTPAAHPNATVHRSGRVRTRSVLPNGRIPKGVPISAIMFGGRPPHDRAARHRGRMTGEHGVFLGLDHGVGDHRCPAGRGRQAPLRPDGDAAVLRVQLRRLLRPLAGHRQGHRSQPAPEDLLRQLVPTRRRRPIPVARLRREQPGPQVGLRALRRRLRGDRHRRSGACPRPARSTPAGSTSTTTTWPRSSRSTPTVGRQAIPQIREHYAQFGDKLTRPAADGRRHPRGPTRLSAGGRPGQGLRPGRRRSRAHEPCAGAGSGRRSEPTRGPTTAKMST